MFAASGNVFGLCVLNDMMLSTRLGATLEETCGMDVNKTNRPDPFAASCEKRNAAIIIMLF